MRTPVMLLGLACLVLGSIGIAQAQPRGGGTIQCSSQDFRVARCRTPAWRDVQLVRQVSQTACVRGRTWGMDKGGIWVDKGCAGVFAEAGRRHPPVGPGPGGPGGWQPGPGWDRTIDVRCESTNFRYRMCQIDTGTGGRVFIKRQLSNTACVQGRTWGYNRAGVWVDQGCAAVFSIERRWR